MTNKFLVKYRRCSLLLSERVHRGAETESSLGRSFRKYSWEKLLQNQLRVWRVCECVCMSDHELACDQPCVYLKTGCECPCIQPRNTHGFCLMSAIAPLGDTAAVSRVPKGRHSKVIHKETKNRHFLKLAFFFFNWDEPFQTPDVWSRIPSISQQQDLVKRNSEFKKKFTIRCFQLYHYVLKG